MSDDFIQDCLVNRFQPNLSFITITEQPQAERLLRSRLEPLPENELASAPLAWQMGLVRAIDRLFDHLLTLTREPAIRCTVDGQVFVEVMGMSVFEVQAAGRLVAWLWTVDAEGQLKVERVEGSHICVDGVPVTSKWLDFYLEAFQRLSGMERVLSPGRVQRVMWWLKFALRHACWHASMRRAVRARVREVLRLDPTALRRARRLFVQSDSRRLTRLDAYNRAVTRASSYESLEREAPALAALLDQFGDDLPLDAHLAPSARAATAGTGQPSQHPVDIKQALRAHLLSQGIQPAFWRALTRVESAHALRLWFQVVIGLFKSTGPQPAVRALALLRLAQVADASKLVDPAWMVDVLAGAVTQLDITDEAELCEAAMPLMRFRGRLEQLARKASCDDRIRLQAQMDEVLEWATLHLQTHTEESLHRLQLASILRRADPERKSQWLFYSGLGELPLAVDVSVTHPEFEAVLLRSGLDLWREGEVMRHCVAGLHERAFNGLSVFVSVRRKGPDSDLARPLATFEIDLRHRPRLAEIKGFANSGVDRDVFDFARLCVCLVRARLQIRQRGREAHLLVDQLELPFAA